MVAPPLPDNDCDDDDDDGTTNTCDVEAFFVEPMVDTLYSKLRYSLGNLLWYLVITMMMMLCALQ